MGFLIYTISFCQDCEAAFDWFDENNVDYLTIDLQKDIPILEELEGFAFLLGCEVYELIKDEDSNLSPQEVYSLVKKDPALLKSPIITDGSFISLGWNEDTPRRLTSYIAEFKEPNRHVDFKDFEEFFPGDGKEFFDEPEEE